MPSSSTTSRLSAEFAEPAESAEPGRRLRRARRGASPVAAVWLAVALPAAADDAAAWLMKINRAAAAASFSGVFVNLDSGEATRVVHRVQGGVSQSRLISLNGEAREVVRDAARVRCYMPAEKVGVSDARQAQQGGFPRLAAGDLARISRHYRLTLGGGAARIAGRAAQRIDITPVDAFRYAYRLWADADTGLLLRSDLIGADGAALETYQFVSIDFDRAIHDRDLQAAAGDAQLTWYGRAAAATAAEESTESPNWRFARIPPGYQLDKRLRRVSPMNGRAVEHMVWSDGLATLSVFIRPAGGGDGNSGGNAGAGSGYGDAGDDADGGDARGDGGDDGGVRDGLTRMGAVHAFHRAIGDYRVTVMGEVPARTVQAFAEGMSEGG